MTKKKTKRQKYMIEVLSACYVDGAYQSKGTTLKVSKELHDRVILEKDGQLKAFIK